jgi:rare lipoprotein A
MKGFLFFLMMIVLTSSAFAQKSSKPSPKLYYGTASYYADKFHGQQTANGEIFSQQKMTAACNVVPLGTWIKVTNLKNKKSVVLRVTDRLHKKTKRVVDLPRIAAKELNYISAGLTRVKVEVLPDKS